MIQTGRRREADPSEAVMLGSGFEGSSPPLPGVGVGYVIYLLPGTGTSKEYFVRYRQLLKKTMGQPDSGNGRRWGD